jgi:hypothetical protein
MIRDYWIYFFIVLNLVTIVRTRGDVNGDELLKHHPPNPRFPSSSKIHRTSFRSSQSSFPSSFPSSSPTQSVSTPYQFILINETGTYDLPSGNKEILITGEGQISINGNQGKKIYLIPPTGNQITIKDFNNNWDKLNISSFFRFRRINQIPFTKNPLILTLSSHQKLILPSHYEMDLTAENFIFAPLPSAPKGKNMKMFSFDNFFIITLAVTGAISLAILSCILWNYRRKLFAMKCFQKLVFLLSNSVEPSDDDDDEENVMKKKQDEEMATFVPSGESSRSRRKKRKKLKEILAEGMNNPNNHDNHHHYKSQNNKKRRKKNRRVSPETKQDKEESDDGGWQDEQIGETAYDYFLLASKNLRESYKDSKEVDEEENNNGDYRPTETTDPFSNVSSSFPPFNNYQQIPNYSDYFNPASSSTFPPQYDFSSTDPYLAQPQFQFPPSQFPPPSSYDPQNNDPSSFYPSAPIYYPVIHRFYWVQKDDKLELRATEAVEYTDDYSNQFQQQYGNHTSSEEKNEDEQNHIEEEQTLPLEEYSSPEVKPDENGETIETIETVNEPSTAQEFPGPPTENTDNDIEKHDNEKPDNENHDKESTSVI